MNSCLKYTTGTITMDCNDFCIQYLNLGRKLWYDANNTKLVYLTVPEWNIIIGKIYRARVIFNEWINHQILGWLNSKNILDNNHVIEFLSEKKLIDSKTIFFPESIWNLSTNILNKVDSIVNYNNWLEIFINEFIEKYPSLYAISELKEDILKYDTWIKSFTIGFYSGDNIRLSDGMNESRLDEFEKHARVNTTLIQDKVDELLWTIKK